MTTETYERGRILQVLADNEGISSAVGMNLLLRTLDNLGVSLSIRELALRLEYLAQKGYVELRRREDIPGWDRTRKGAGRPKDVMSARLTAKGLDLVQGSLVPDPGVAFEVA